MRDAVVSGNTFDVPLKNRQLIVGILANIAIMTVTYELPRYPVFASIYKSGATQIPNY